MEDAESSLNGGSVKSTEIHGTGYPTYWKEYWTFQKQRTRRVFVISSLLWTLRKSEIFIVVIKIIFTPLDNSTVFKSVMFSTTETDFVVNFYYLCSCCTRKWGFFQSVKVLWCCVILGAISVNDKVSFYSEMAQFKKQKLKNQIILRMNLSLQKFCINSKKLRWLVK